MKNTINIQYKHLKLN